MGNRVMRHIPKIKPQGTVRYRDDYGIERTETLEEKVRRMNRDRRATERVK